MDGTYRSEEPVPEESFLTSVVDTVRNDSGEFILMAFIAIVIVYGFFEARGLRFESGFVPQIILGMMAVCLVLILVMKFFGDTVETVFRLDESESVFDIHAEAQETHDPTEQLFDLDAWGVIKHFSWIIVYLLGLVYIGFWTTNILFPFVYIMLHETSPIPRRFAYFALWTGMIVAVLWILFVELLLVQAIWRLGFLP